MSLYNAVNHSSYTKPQDIILMTMEDEVLKPKNAFCTEDGQAIDIEVRVRMVNINYGRNKEPMEACKPLFEYAWLIEKIRDYGKDADIKTAAASYMYGLPEQKIHHVTFENAEFSFAENPTAGVPAMMDGVDKQTNTGILAKNIETLELKNVTVSGQAGDAVISDGIGQFVQ